MRFTVRPPDPAQYRRLEREHVDIQRKAARVATHKASVVGQRRVQAAMKAAGLGRLPNAVGQTSSQKERHKLADVSVGLIYAKGGDDSLAGGALEIYSRGGTIKPVKGEWLWFATKALQRNVRVGRARMRMTPAVYNALGKQLGELHFRRINSRVAILYAEDLNVHVRTGRAKLPGKRKSRVAVRKKRVTLFVGIRFTNRMKRFDKDVEMAFAAGLIPDYIAEEIDTELVRRGLQ